MNSIIKNNINLFVGLIIGIVISGIGVYAINSLNAGSISIDKSKMNKVENNNLQSALDYLYSQSEKNNLVTIESGVLHRSQTYLGIIYLDPTNLERKCSEADEKLNRNNDGTITGVKSGCMKWYIYKDLGDSYLAILDHNTTARVQYNSDNVNTSMKEVSIALTNDTIEWNSNLSPRIITANEIAEIAKVNWNSDNATISDLFCLDFKTADKTHYCRKIQGTSSYAWLFDNLGWSNDPCTNYGCNITDTLSSASYWTDTPITSSDIYIWGVNRFGMLDYLSAKDSLRGLRPVITISKSLFNN